MRKLLLYEKQAQKSGEVSPRGVLGREPSFMSSASTSGSGGIAVSGSRPSNPNPLRSGSLPRIARPLVTRNPTAKDDISVHSLLGNLEGSDASGVSTEFEVEVPLPGCQSVKTPIDPRNKNSPMIPIKFHHGTIWPNITVHHWIKIVLRISKVDETAENKSKRRHFEISIDSPVHLLSVFLSPYLLLTIVSIPSKYIFTGIYKSDFDSVEWY